MLLGWMTILDGVVIEAKTDSGASITQALFINVANRR